MPTSADPRSWAAFILTNGRPEKQLTYRSLRRHGYTGRIVLVVDDEDPTLDAYRERFGDEVETFSKAEVAETFDPADLSTDRRTIVYARNASYEIARRLGLDYFLALDDDYTSFLYRYTGRQGPYSHKRSMTGATEIRSFDQVAEAMFRLLDDTGAVTVAMSQGGDHIGGGGAWTMVHGYKRKAMNSFFLRTDRPVRFVGRLNEDVNAYALFGSRGDLFLSVSALQLNQAATQGTPGGMTEIYLASGTYVKSFYTVLMCPSFVTIAPMGTQQNRRLHHRIAWENAVPKILAPELRRG
jgi:hypothetical protein